MYRMGLGDATVTPAQAAAAPPATVSPYGAVECGFGQKMVGNGPFTCAFDPMTAAGEAWQIPGIYLGMVAPASLSSAVGANGLSAIAWGGALLLGFMLFGRKGRR